MISEPFTIPIDPFDEGEGFAVEVRDPEREERDYKIINYFENAFHILSTYQSHQDDKDKTMSLRTMLLALGFRLAAGAEGPAELARAMGYSKQAVNKCLNHFIAQLRLTELPGQRKPDARESMSLARKNQLKGKTNGHLQR